MSSHKIFDNNGNLKASILRSREIINHLVTCPWLLEFASSKTQDNFKVVNLAVRHQGFVLQYASNRLKKNKEIVASAVEDSEYAFLFADNSLHSDIDFCLHLLKLNPNVYPLLHEKFKNSIRFIARAIRWNPVIYKDVPNEYVFKSSQLKRLVLLNINVSKYYHENTLSIIKFLPNKTTCLLSSSKQANSIKDFLKFIKSKKFSLRHCNTSIRSNSQCVLLAMNKSPFEIRYANKSLLSCKKFMFQACNIYPDSFSYADNSLKNDAEFLRKLSTANPSSLRYANKNLLNEKEFAIELVREEGSFIRSLPYSLKKEREIAELAIHSEPLSLRYVEHLKSDVNLIKSAITKNPFSVYFASLDKIDRADLEDIACKFLTSFEFAKMADLKKSYHLIFEKSSNFFDFETSRNILVRTIINKKFRDLQYSSKFALYVYHNFDLLQFYYDWHTFFKYLADLNPLIAKLYIKGGYKASDEEFFINSDLIKHHFILFSNLSSSMLGSFREVIMKAYTREAMDIFSASLIKDKFLSGRKLDDYEYHEIYDSLCKRVY